MHRYHYIAIACIIAAGTSLAIALTPSAGQTLPDNTPIIWQDMLPSAIPLRPWTYIVIHHSGTDAGSTSGIDRHHREENGWDGIGYHYVVGNGAGMRLGRIEYTFRWDQQREGAHAGGSDKSYNQRGIGICLIGNFEQHQPTDTQLQRSVELCAVLIENISSLHISSIIGHQDVPEKKTECPGQHLNLIHFRRAVSALLRQRADQRQLKARQALQP